MGPIKVGKTKNRKQITVTNFKLDIFIRQILDQKIQILLRRLEKPTWLKWRHFRENKKDGKRTHLLPSRPSYPQVEALHHAVG